MFVGSLLHAGLGVIIGCASNASAKFQVLQKDRMTEVRFAFGTSGLPITVPDGYTYELIESRTAPAIVYPLEAINHALDHPVAGPSLQELARNRKSAAISVCDITRPAPNRITLPFVLEKLHKAGINADNITILIATGLHRGATPDEIQTIVGAEIAAQYKVLTTMLVERISSAFWAIRKRAHRFTSTIGIWRRNFI